MVDGGTQGQTLLTYVERADRLLVLDAVDFGLEPGEMVLREQMPAYLTAQKIGPHQNSFSEVLGLATLRGNMPGHCALIGVQPAAMTLGAALSPAVACCMDKGEAMALDVLRQWGVNPARRENPVIYPHLRWMPCCWGNCERLNLWLGPFAKGTPRGLKPVSGFTRIQHFP